MKKYCLYERGMGWVQYEEETFLALRRERLNTRMRRRRQKRCFCPKEERWRCDGMCEDCCYKRETEISLETNIGGFKTLTLSDVRTDGIDYENMCVERMYCEDVLKKLDEIMPLARQIGELRLEGKSDRQIARELGIDRMTMVRMLARAKTILKVEL